jgi:hypothetical protein
MVTIPRITFRSTREIFGFVLIHGEHLYELGSICFWREASILGPALKHSFSANYWPIRPSFDLPYEADDILVRRKPKYAGRPFILRRRSYQKGYRYGDLYLPFDDFRFREQRTTVTEGYEQVTRYQYRSALAPEIRIPYKEIRTEVPDLANQAQEALAIYLQKQTLKAGAERACNEAESRYYKLDPRGRFLSEYNEVKEKLN